MWHTASRDGFHCFKYPINLSRAFFNRDFIACFQQVRRYIDRFAVNQADFAAGLAKEPQSPLTEVGPLTVSTWHQEAPFNTLCPMGDSGSYNWTAAPDRRSDAEKLPCLSSTSGTELVASKPLFPRWPE